VSDSSSSPAADVPKPSQARVLALSFQAVFGQPGRNARGPDQRRVLAHLRTVCAVDTNMFQFTPGVPADPIAAAHRDGARAVFMIIERQLAAARKDDEVEKPKIRVKKKA